MTKLTKRPLQEDITNIEKKIKKDSTNKEFNIHDLDKNSIKTFCTDFEESVRWTPETKEELKEKLLLYYGENVDKEKKKQFQHISLWNTKKITNFDNLFEGVELTFNEDISNWNTSNVVSMIGTFEGLELFNQNISTKFIENKLLKENSYYAWDVSNVKDMCNILNDCCSFNQNITNWNVTNVTDLSSSFYNCIEFNQDIETKPIYLNNEFKWFAWDTKNCKNMDNMFSSDNHEIIPDFNGNISNWNISNCRSLRMMFRYSIFQHDISTKTIFIEYKSNLCSSDYQIYTYTAWDTSNMEDISHMFSCHKNFDNSYLKIENWNLRNVINISCTFENIDFNFDITHWSKYLKENIKQFFSLFNRTRFRCMEQYKKIKLFFEENEVLPFWDVLINDYAGEDEWELNDEYLKYLKSLTGLETDNKCIEYFKEKNSATISA